jgi:purine-binding chemotaxis protein CheW
MKAFRLRADASKMFVGFLLNNVHYAVEISRVVQVLRPLPMTAPPYRAYGLVGVAEHRGEIMSVVDLRSLFALPTERMPVRSKWILLDLGEQLLCLVVDDITNVFGLEERALRPPPLTTEVAHAAMLSGVALYDGRLTFLLDVDRFRGPWSSVPVLSPGRAQG